MPKPLSQSAVAKLERALSVSLLTQFVVVGMAVVWRPANLAPFMLGFPTIVPLIGALEALKRRHERGIWMWYVFCLAVSLLFNGTILVFGIIDIIRGRYQPGWGDLPTVVTIYNWVLALIALWRVTIDNWRLDRPPDIFPPRSM